MFPEAHYDKWGREGYKAISSFFYVFYKDGITITGASRPTEREREGEGEQEKVQERT